MSRNRIIFLWISFFIAAPLVLAPSVSAQDVSLGIASYITIPDKDTSDGNIVSLSEDGYILSDKAYDAKVIGVVSDNPAVSLNFEELTENSYAVLSSGNVKLSVSTINGPISEGDLLTSSEIKGIGMKADKAGYVVGTALESFDEKNPQTIGKINVSLNLHYANNTAQLKNSFLDIFQLSTIATYENPLTVFRYFIAGIVVIASIIVGFLSFGRVASQGIEALGRNPLASRTIQLGIIINTIITIAIIIAGISIAYFVVTIG